jgi:hypothetical protein
MLVEVRPSNEALFRARVPGAQDERGYPSIHFIVQALRARRATWPLTPHLPRPRVARAQKIISLQGVCLTLHHFHVHTSSRQ